MKETKELLIALVAIGAFVAKRAKDGIQLGDAMALGTALVADDVFKAKIFAGVQGLDKVDDELKDLDLVKVLALAKVIPELLKEIQK